MSNRILSWLLLLLAGGLGACKGKSDVRPPAPADQTQEQTVRVLLLNNATTCRFAVNSPFLALSDAEPATANAGKKRFQGADHTFEVTLSQGLIKIASQTFAAREVLIEPEETDFFRLDGIAYRGELHLIVNDDDQSFDVVNHLPLESYLAGVVGAEMPDYWEPEALKAQTIAARTYCLYTKKRFGEGRSWDVTKTQANQVYRGVQSESAQVRSAINRTKGKVLVCLQADGSEDIFPCYYSSACGGHTENSRNVFGDSFPPLVGVECPYCVDVARPKYYFWPTAKFSRQEVSRRLLDRYPKLQKLGRIADIVVSEQSDFGPFSRLTKVKLFGPEGKNDWVRAEDLRLTLDPSGKILRSTICNISKSGSDWVFRFGRGFGHGVGMCQCGAQAMARQGRNAREILAYYYPDSRIAGAY